MFVMDTLDVYIVNTLFGIIHIYNTLLTYRVYLFMKDTLAVYTVNTLFGITLIPFLFIGYSLFMKGTLAVYKGTPFLFASKLYLSYL